MRPLVWQLRQTYLSRRFAGNFFAPIGVCWGLVELLHYVGYGNYLALAIPYWWLLPVLSLIFATWHSWQRRTIRVRIPQFDSQVEVMVGGIFASKSPMVFGVPTTFDHDIDSGLISERSLQGRFSAMYYKNQAEMRMAMEAEVEKLGAFVELSSAEKPYGPARKFKPGEMIVLKNKRRTGYAVALATFNQHRRAQLTVDEFLEALPTMWLGIRERGEIGTIAIPLLGSGHARLNLTKKAILREIVASFVAASSEGRLADGITIYITASDFLNGEFTFLFIERTLEMFCDDHVNLGPSRTSTGTALSG